MDYDVEVIALKTPASTSPLAACRLVVSVRNNGKHNAVASGYVRIYSAGLQVFESEVFSDTLTPGQTGDCSSTGYWTPAAEGVYMLQGYISTPLDQVEPNNNLNPTTIHITGTPPTPPTPVELHAAQHEEGGTDELSIEGLPGRAADPQTAEAHAAQHQAGGSDALNVGSLQGILAQDQPTQVHSNTRHFPILASSDELTSHQTGTAVHTAATNLANRETTGIHTGLVKGAQLVHATIAPDAGDDENRQALGLDRNFGPANPVHHAAKHAVGGLDELAIPSVITGIERNKLCTPGSGLVNLVALEMTAAMAKPGTVGHFEISGTVNTGSGVGQTVTFTLFHQDDLGSITLAACTFALNQNKIYTFHCTAKAGIGIGALLAGLFHGELVEVPTLGEQHQEARYTGNSLAPAATSRFYIGVIWTNGALASTLTGTDCLGMGVVRR